MEEGIGQALTYGRCNQKSETDSAKAARAFGAEDIGLCRTERKDFAGLFETMNGFPVVIRTLDPPLHEFVPKREELMVDLAKLPTADIKANNEMLNRYKNFAPDVKSLKTVLRVNSRYTRIHAGSMR